MYQEGAILRLRFTCTATLATDVFTKLPKQLRNVQFAILRTRQVIKNLSWSTLPITKELNIEKLSS